MNAETPKRHGVIVAFNFGGFFGNVGPGSRDTGYGVPGPKENTGSKWKTRGLSGKHEV